MTPDLVNEFQSGHRRVGTERAGECLAGCWVSDDLLRPDLVLERRFYVGVNQKLHARRKAISCAVER